MRHKEPEEPKDEGSPDTDQQEPKEKKGELEDLRAAIESLQKEKDELFGKLQRVSADYANFQKRVPRQIADTIGYEKERIIKALLPVLDNFEHTLQNARSAEKDGLVKGIRIIYDQLLDVLKSHNVEQVDALGEKFDPVVHEAMTQQTNLQKEEGVVLEEFQKGYRLNGRVIRPSRVVVNKLPEQMEPQQEAQRGEQAGDECETTDVE
jgi:molecular chaperone GrpE